MDINTLLNWIKWQFKYRIPDGDLFNCAIYGNNLKKGTLAWYVNLCDLYNDPISKLILGYSITAQEKHIPFAKYLDSEYNKSNNDYYSFKMSNGNYVNIPIPEMDDFKGFRLELTDIILPYLLGYPNTKHFPFHEGPYEYKDICLKKGDVVFDLGANYGLFSALAASKGCRVYAFEPTIETFNNYLSKTASLNSNIIPCNLAVSDENGTQSFLIDEEDCRCNGVAKTKTNLLKHSQKEIQVSTITLDKFVSDNNLERVDFIKADIEGAERLMLKGAKEVLKEFKPNLSICYYHLIDDFKVLKELILDANPDYEIERRYKKIYAYHKKR